MSTPTRDDAPSAATGVPQWTIGDRIRKARREADLSQQQLADAIGITVNRLGNWEAGYNKPGDIIGVARAIAHVTGVRADWIAGLYLSDAEGSVVDRSGHRRDPDPANRQGYSRSRMRTRSSLLVRHPANVA